MEEIKDFLEAEPGYQTLEYLLEQAREKGALKQNLVGGSFNADENFGVKEIDYKFDKTNLLMEIVSKGAPDERELRSDIQNILNHHKMDSTTIRERKGFDYKLSYKANNLTELRKASSMLD
jgi:hypothetical protein